MGFRESSVDAKQRSGSSLNWRKRLPITNLMKHKELGVFESVFFDEQQEFLHKSIELLRNSRRT